MSYPNIHTQWIQEALDVNQSVALRVQDQINNNYDLDWSEADFDEIEFYAELAFEDLNTIV
jgi:hypothetical protein